MAQLNEILIPYNENNRNFFPIPFHKESLFKGNPIQNIQCVDLPFQQLKEMSIQEFEQQEVRGKFADSTIKFIKESSLLLDIEQTKLVINNIIGKDIDAEINVQVKDKVTLLRLLKAYLLANEELDYFNLGLIPLYFNSSFVFWGLLSYSIQEGNNLDLSVCVVASSLRYNLNDLFLVANAIEKDGSLNVWHTYKNIGEDLFQFEVFEELVPFFSGEKTQELPLIIANINYLGHMNNALYLGKDDNSLTSVREIFERLYHQEPLLFTIDI